MKRIFVPSHSPADWQRLLAEPAKQWRSGCSARSLACCWEAAGSTFPPEILSILQSADNPAFEHAELLLAIPEWQVPLPPSRGHPSQNDLFVLARDAHGGLVSIMVEGKVSEPFGQTLSEWLEKATPGRRSRLEFLQNTLGLTRGIPGSIRYQLLHRTASALIEAERFGAKSALMLVHSFSPDRLWLEDYRCFLELFGILSAVPGQLYRLPAPGPVHLYSGWAEGNPSFLSA
jgi:hypothetical protein